MSDALPEKVRVRSEAELAARGRNLAALSDALDEIGLAHYLSGGALLGAARDGDFIPWDWDAEFSVRTEEALPLLDRMVGAIASAGLEVIDVDRSHENLKVLAEREGSKFEIRGYHRDGKSRLRRDFRTQDRFFRETTRVELRGRTYDCLGPIGDYLLDRYGDWRTPVRSVTKSDYLAPNYFIRSRHRRRASKLLAALRRRSNWRARQGPA